MTEPFRRERAGVDHPQMAWTSFDRYGRYGAIVHALRANLGDGPLRVLDVGDTAGHLASFDEGLQVVGVDLQIAEERLGRPAIARADGTRLPFPDRAFDVVVSSDVLEHVAPEGRDSFLAELSRVSRDLVIVAAPFDTPGVAGVEELVRRYALLATGTKQPQLDEHQVNGLPDLDRTVAALVADGSQVTTFGDGHLWDWLVIMVLRFQLVARPALDPLVSGYDMLYNLSLADRSLLPPFYRHIVVARRVGEPVTGRREAVNPIPGDFGALAAALVAADSTEVVRQDTVPRLETIQKDIDGLAPRIDALDARLTGDVAALRERLEALIELEVSVAQQLIALKHRLWRLTHPFRRKGADPDAATEADLP